jgi:transcription initiation factor TFIIIB Brf1 subunit/transcription initiation factor TFIIB
MLRNYLKCPNCGSNEFYIEIYHNVIAEIECVKCHDVIDRLDVKLELHEKEYPDD